MAGGREAFDAEMTSGVRNMYGCLPCPRCGSEYRYPRVSGTQDCDECGFVEPLSDALREYLAPEEA